MGANSSLYNRKLLAVAVSSCVLASGAASAQENAIEEVVVTGIRASLERSVDIKRESSGVVDAISAEDIGKFPDSNLAESLQRITGVSIDRNNGEGFQVTVRGFGPQYNLITLNGRSMPAGQIGAEGGLINQRSFDMSNIASEGVSGVEVYKTGKASFSSGGIGSVVNLKTMRPLDNPGVKASFGAKALYDTTNVANDEITPEISGLLSWTDENEMFGASISGSYQERDSMSAGLRSGNGWTNFQGAWAGTDSIPNGTTSGVLVENAPAAGTMTNFVNGPSMYRADYQRTRKNGQITLQYRPSDAVTATLDYTLAEQETKLARSGTSFWFGGGAFATDAIRFNGNTEAASPVLWWTENQNVTDNTGQTFYDENRNYDDTAAPRDIAVGLQHGHVQNTLESAGINVEWTVTDQLSLTFDAHDSSTKSRPGDGSIANFYNIGLGVQGVYNQGIDYTGDLPLLVGNFVDVYPTLDHDCDATTPAVVQQVGTVQTDRDCSDGDGVASGENVISTANQAGGLTPMLIDKGDVGSTVRQINYDRLSVDMTQMKIDGRFDLNDDMGIDFGVESSKMESVQNSSFAQELMEGGWGVSNPGDVPAGLFHEIDYADYFDGYRTNLSSDSRSFFETAAGQSVDVFMVGFMGDVPAIGETLANNAGLTWAPNPTDNVNRKLTEEITAFYIQGDLHFDLAGMPLDVLAGVRYESTDVTSDATIAPNAVVWQGDNDFLANPDNSVAPTDFKSTHSYDHVLPAIDVSLGIQEDLIGRVSYSTTIARADYDQLSQGVSGVGGPSGGPTVLGGSPGTATSGNVSLEPIESNNFDVSIEWYFGDASYASVGAFYKDVPNFIGIESFPDTAADTRDPSNGPRAMQAVQDLQDLGADVNQQNLFMMVASYGGAGCTGSACGAAYGSLPYEGSTGVENNADIVALPEDPFSVINGTRPANANGANLSGLEFAVQHFFGESGFGVAANYTYVDGSVTFDNSAVPAGASQFALVGLSDSANLAVMYEKDGWQARVAYNWRDEFLNSANIGSNEPEYTNAYSQIDFNVGYNFSDNFSVALEGLNVLGADIRRVGRNDNQTRRLEIYQPRYALTGRYTF